MWTLLKHQGNSDTEQRIALIERYLALFGAASIQWLLGAREFIGAKWIDFLNKNNIPFAIRARESQSIALKGNKICSLRTLLRHRRARSVVHTFEGRLPETGMPVRIAIKQLKGGEWLIVMTNATDGKAALDMPIGSGGALNVCSVMPRRAGSTWKIPGSRTLRSWLPFWVFSP